MALDSVETEAVQHVIQQQGIRKSSLVYIMLTTQYKWYYWNAKKSTWCLWRKNISFSCLLDNWCFSWRCRSSISQRADSLDLRSWCFCCRNCRSRRAILSRWSSPNLLRDTWNKNGWAITNSHFSNSDDMQWNNFFFDKLNTIACMFSR